MGDEEFQIEGNSENQTMTIQGLKSDDESKIERSKLPPTFGDQEKDDCEAVVAQITVFMRPMFRSSISESNMTTLGYQYQFRTG
jgi:hypothetical protein